MGVNNKVRDYIYEQISKGFTKGTVMRKAKEKYPRNSHRELRGCFNTCLFIYDLDMREGQKKLCN